MLLKVEHLSRHFPVYEEGWSRRLTGVIRAVEDVSFALAAGRSLVILGEAGAGKTTLARLLSRLDTPDAGRIGVEGKEASRLRGRDLQNWRQVVQYVYPNPRTAIDAKQTVGALLEEPLRLSRRKGREAGRDWLETVRETLGLNAFLSQKYPRALSVAILQRVAMARALALRPALLICDAPGDHLEPAALRPLIAALRELQREGGFGLIWTARGPERSLKEADDALVLYRGRAVEWGPAKSVLSDPRHPYARKWLGAESAGPSDPQPYRQGCRYHPECPRVMEVCRADAPGMVEVGPGHSAACYLYDETKGSFSA